LSLPDQFALPLELEHFLGDPHDPGNLFSFARAVALDEAESYPEVGFRTLNDWGLNRHYIPAALGGELRSYETLYGLVRAATRRDFTLGFTHAFTYLASSPIFIGGTEAQKQELAEIVRAGEQVSIGYHEKEHGHDYLACELKAERQGDEYVLEGEKWVFGNGDRAENVVIYARTAPRGGPRGFSLFLLRKSQLAPGSCIPMGKFKTLGVRGHEITGLRLNGCRVPADSLIGEAGNAMELTFKSSQITRTLFTAPCLSAVDTALRATLSFACNRRLYGDSLLAIPHARKTIVDAYLDLLMCECLALGNNRALHEAPGQMNLWAAIVKYTIPIVSEEAIRSLSMVLGARHFLREGHWSGIFQKMLRDNSVVRVGHLGSVINLSQLTPQLPRLAIGYRKSREAPASYLWDRLSTIFGLGEALPDFDPSGLTFYNRGNDFALQGLPLAAESIRGTAREGEPVAQTIAERLDQMLGALDRICDLLTGSDITRDPEFHRSARAFELASRYCVLHTAAHCTLIWVHNRRDRDPFFARGAWLAAVLNRLWSQFEPATRLAPPAYEDELAEELLERFEANLLFSLLLIPLAKKTEEQPLEV